MSSIGRWTAFPGAFQESVSPRISTSIMRLLAENLVAKALAGVYFSSKPGWRNKAACMSCAHEMRRSACAARMTVSECVPLHACYCCFGCFSAQEPMARIIGAYCEHLSAPGHHAAILDRHLVGNSVQAFPHLPCCAPFAWNEGSKQTAPRSSAYA